MKITRLIFTLPAFLPLIIIACRFSASGSPPVQATPTQTVSAQQTEFVPHSESVGDANASFANFIPHSEPVGDPNANYANIEFTADGKYMVWFEMTHRQGNGVVWHCAINPETGDLIPPDGRGFRAFESTVYGRANPGIVNNPYAMSSDGTFRPIDRWSGARDPLQVAFRQPCSLHNTPQRRFSIINQVDQELKCLRKLARRAWASG